MADEVHIEPYDPAWPRAFAEEAARLERLAPGAFLRLEHIGSTAVPELAAKPVIDMMGLVTDLDPARAALVPRLADAGYAFWADNPAADRLFFVRGLPPSPQRTHHLHIVDDPVILKRHLAFRGALADDRALRDRYVALKADLAARHGSDREAYTAGKRTFVEAVVGPTPQSPAPQRP